MENIYLSGMPHNITAKSETQEFEKSMFNISSQLIPEFVSHRNY